MTIDTLRGRILSVGEDKLIERSNQADAKARYDVVMEIMNETGCTYEQVVEACTGPDGVRIPE